MTTSVLTEAALSLARRSRERVGLIVAVSLWHSDSPEGLALDIIVPLDCYLVFQPQND